ncbi:hypothetical protein pb186bvf_018359 [Paramecium bursaria]
MKRPEIWNLFQKWRVQKDKNQIKFQLLLKYLVLDRHKFSNKFAEIYKFNPRANLFKHKWPIVFATSLVTATITIIFNKIIYEDYQIRDPGCPVPMEIPTYIAFIRFLKIRVIKLFGGHPFELKGFDDLHQSIARIDQYNYYQKLKETQFDFVYLGEQEQFQFV